jgi:hypothetical protein
VQRFIDAGKRFLLKAFPFLEHARLGREALDTLRRTFTGPLRRAAGPDALRLVIVNHFYDQDIDAYARARTDCELWILHHSAVGGIRAFFQPEPGLAVDYRGPWMQKRVRAARSHFVRQAVAYIRQKVRPDAVVVPSDLFFWLRPILEEFTAVGVPVIAQDKEGTLTPGPLTEENLALWVKRYPPLSQRYLFWGQVQRDAWVKVGLDPAKIRIVGMPRSDFFFHPERHASPESLGLPGGKKLVTFFTFEGDVYLTADVKGRQIGRPWLPMRRDIHETLVRLARERSDVHVIVKVHPQCPEIEEIQAELSSAPSNLTIMLGAATAAHLVANSAVVVGFQTTALIETMLTNKPIVYCGWAPQHDRYLPWLNPIPQSGACFQPASAEAMLELLNGLLDGRLAVPPQMLTNRRAFSSRYFHDARGATADRTLQAIAEEVASWRAARGRRAAA